MTLRKLVRVVPIVAALALAAPVASAHAQSTPAAGPAAIPCYPYPAFCGPNGQPWFSFPAPITIPPITIPTLPPIFHFGTGPVQLPTAPVRVQAP